MMWIELCCYIVAGLIVAKILQKWVEKDPIPLDMTAFISCVILWPIALLVMVAVGFINIVIWFYDLGTKK